MANLIWGASRRILDDNGDPHSGGKIYVYTAGTTDAVTTYSDSALTSANAHPVVADANGIVGPIFVADGASYKIRVADASDVVLYEDDHVAHLKDELEVDVARGFTTVALLVADTEMSYTASATTFLVAAGDYVSAGRHRYQVVASGASDNHLVTAGGVKLDVLPGTGGAYDLAAFNVASDGSSDITTSLQAAIDESSHLVIPPGTYRVDSAINLKSNFRLEGVRGATIIEQHGAKLFQGAASMENLHIEGLTFDMQKSSPTAYDVWANWKTHAYCTIQHLEFQNYAGTTIQERFVAAGDTVNTIYNTYADWEIDDCDCIDIAIGLEGYYYKHTGDGSTTAIATSIAWPATQTGAVVVVEEDSNRKFSEMTAGTDYTCSFDGSNNLTVTLTTAATTTERIHIWPSSPRTDGPVTRRTISNNVWREVRSLRLDNIGWQQVRWVDAESFTDCSVRLTADSAKAFATNPYERRSGQGGDYASFEGCVVSYIDADVATPNTLVGFDFGPGSYAMRGDGVRMDNDWLHSGTNYAISYRDRRSVALTGTVSGTSGTSTVTGSGTSFLTDLQIIGATADQVEIESNIYGITSIDSDTQITLSSNLSTSPSGATMNRIHKASHVDAVINFASMGDGFQNTNPWQSGEVTINSRTKRAGTATITNGTTSVTVTHGLRRTPLAHEIMLTANDLLGGRSISTSTLGATTFQINLSSTSGSDLDIAWRAELMDLN